MRLPPCKIPLARKLLLVCRKGRKGNSMATFNGTYENAYAQQLMGEFFRNSLRYFKGEVRDSEYFKPVMSMLDERGIEQRIYDRFGGEALVTCGVARTCEEAGRGPHNGRQYGAPV